MHPQTDNNQINSPEKSKKHWEVNLRLHKKSVIIVFIAMFASVGAYQLWRTYAATSVGSIEAEAMLVTSGTFNSIDDTNASGGKARSATTASTISGTLTTNGPATSLLIKARGLQCNGSPIINLSIDNRPIQSTTVTTTTWTAFTVPVALNQGAHTVVASYANPYVSTRGGKTKCSRTLILDNFIFMNDNDVASETLLSLAKTATASSVESGTSFVASNAFDGDATTRWSSAYSDPQWLSVDLGAAYPISHVNIAWENAYGTGYQLQTSLDGVTWTTMYTTSTGDGGVDDITGLSSTGRYVRMYGNARISAWGYSIWELKIYGNSLTNPATPPSSTTDTTSPITSLTNPLSGATLSGVSIVTASASDNVAVTKVEFYVDNILAATDTTSPYSFSWDTTTNSNASHALYAKAYDAAGNSGNSSTITVTVSNITPMNNVGSQPYLYLGWGSPQDPVAVMNSTGIKRFTMAFMLSSGTGSCNPAWDGSRPLLGGNDEKTIAAIRNAGGDIVISFGGWSGTKLGPNCADSAQYAAAVQKVVDAYKLKYIDFDIENLDELENSVVQDRILGGIKIIKQNNPGVQAIITVGTTISGPTAMNSRVITQAAKLGVPVDVFTVMAFDFGGASDMYANTVSAAVGLKNLLKTTYGWTDSVAFAHVGISGMVGNSDQMEVTTPDIWTQIRDWANANRIARLSTWAVNRDRPCPGGGIVDNCSGISQTDLQFTRITSGFNGIYQ